MEPAILVKDLNKRYGSGFQALKNINLEIRKGEIFALLGPNGAGKTTLISCLCSIVKPSSGDLFANGHNIVTNFRAARASIGLVPQELSTDAFESVMTTVTFSRGLFGKPANPAHIEKVLRQLSLWDKRDSKIMALSGGMKRRLMIAKALSHEPQILFLDEPTAEIVLVEDKQVLMHKLGKRQLTLQLQTAMTHLPADIKHLPLELTSDGSVLIYTFDTQSEHTGIAELLKQLSQHGIDVKDLHSTQSSLEDIFVNLIRTAS
ncbi:MAG: ABC transporter ATP-binding protein [Gammaproteobacteria bacterium]